MVETQTGIFTKRRQKFYTRSESLLSLDGLHRFQAQHLAYRSMVSVTPCLS